jgi:hypothetical protein
MPRGIAAGRWLCNWGVVFDDARRAVSFHAKIAKIAKIFKSAVL